MPSIETKKRIKSIVSSSVMLNRIYSWTSAFGIDFLKLFDAFRGISFVINDYIHLKRANNNSKNPWIFKLTMPNLADKYAVSGIAEGHYFHQDMLVARKIFERNPRRHVDVGSRIDGFVAHVATFRSIEVFDIRLLRNKIKNVVFTQLDLMKPSLEYISYCDSLSCLHTIEHFGLGRYGDPLNINGYELGFINLTKILQINGILYLSTPIGKQRIDFNSHRVFNIETILKLAENNFELIGFSYVDDKGDIHENIELNTQVKESNFGCNYGCGIFEFRKIK